MTGLLNAALASFFHRTRDIKSPQQMKNITGKTTIEIKAPASRVWDALTRPEQIKQYLFGTDTVTDWKVGSPITFKGVYDGKTYEDKGTILEVNPHKTIRYTYWSSLSGVEDKPENYVPVTYSLSETKDFTVLTVTQENIVDEKTKEHSEENWKKVLAGLKSMVEKQVEPAY
jgi:uncharacterized protein YndB with AHSA1/START domain